MSGNAAGNHEDENFVIDGEVIDGEALPPEGDLADGGEEEVVLMIGDAPAPEEDEEELNKAPEWVRKLRKDHREAVKRNRELEQRLAEKETVETKPTVELGPKPKIEDYEFDAQDYEKALDEWHENRRKFEEEDNRIKSDKKRQEDEWNTTLEGYKKAKSELKFKDVDESESLAFGLLDVTQQGIVISGCENPALVMYAIGKDPVEGKKLSSLKDPVKFATAIGKFEGKLKMAKRSNTPPPPEKKVTQGGGTSKSGAVDSTLERLRADAAKTGDFSKVHEYKRQLKSKK